MRYKLFLFSWETQPSLVLRFNEDGSQSNIPFDEANTDYQQYLAWLAEGNEPIPADNPEQVNDA